MDGDFCDVKIKFRDLKIQAHRCVLASATEFFKAMFSNETKEAETGIIEFPETPPEVVKQCIEFIYSGKVEISMKTARDLVDASEMMQLPGLSKLCVEYLAERVDMKNCAEVISLSYLYNKDSLNEPLKQFLRSNFSEFKETDEFTCFTPGALKHCYCLLGKGDADNEKDKWFSTLKWIEGATEERKSHFADIFHLLDLSVIPTSFMKQHIVRNPFVNSSVLCVRLVLENVLSDDREKTHVEMRTEPEHYVSFEIGSDVIYCHSVAGKAPIGCPVRITIDMDVFEHNSKLFIGTGLTIYAYINNVWDSKPVKVSLVRRTRPCITCADCHLDHWYVGSEYSVYKSGNSSVWNCCSSEFYFGDEWRHDAIACKTCKKAMGKRSSRESCYNCCVGVGDSVYMLTREYIIEYIISKSQIVHHYTSIGLGNGFAVAASSECIYAIGGNGTECKAVAFDIKSNSLTRLGDMSYGKTFSRAIFDNGRLYATAKDARRMEYYDFLENIWKGQQ